MRLRRNQLVAVRFLDHVQGGGTPLEFVVYGRLLHVDKQSLTVGVWVYADGRATDGNEQTYTIVRSCVKQVVQLTERTHA